jgi:hypothetical protein
MGCNRAWTEDGTMTMLSTGDSDKDAYIDQNSFCRLHF